MHAASGKGDSGWTFACRPEDPDCTFEDLAVPGPGLESIDAKIGIGARLIVESGGQPALSLRIQLETEKAREDNRILRGRQIVWLIYRRYDLDEEYGQAYSLDELSKVTYQPCKGEFANSQALELFLTRYTHTPYKACRSSSVRPSRSNDTTFTSRSKTANSSRKSCASGAPC